MQADDRQLVRRFLGGEPAAFDALYHRHAARVFRLLCRLTADSSEAEDLTQETFLSAFRDLHSWRGKGALATWLCGIAFHHYSRSRRALVHTVSLDEQSDLPARDADPLARCLESERRQRIEAAIAALAPLYREVFVLVKVEGLSYQQTAEWLGVPLGTVQWRLWKAVRLLQAALDDPPDPDVEHPAGRARRTNNADPATTGAGTAAPSRCKQARG